MRTHNGSGFNNGRKSLTTTFRNLAMSGHHTRVELMKGINYDLVYSE